MGSLNLNADLLNAVAIRRGRTLVQPAVDDERFQVNRESLRGQVPEHRR